MKLKGFLLPIFSLLLIATVIVVGSCGVQTQSQTQVIKDINAQEAFSLIKENKDNPDFVIIDVRTPSEFTDGHIEYAVNIDYNNENFRNEIGQLNKDNTYLIYCRTGNRSRGALGIMTELSFGEVYHLSVGIVGWLAEGLPTVK